MRRVHVVNVNHIARDRSASKRSVCLAERYNSLNLERAREKYAADIYGPLVSIFSINHQRARKKYAADIYRPLVSIFSVNHLHQGLIPFLY